MENYAAGDFPLLYELGLDLYAIEVVVRLGDGDELVPFAIAGLHSKSVDNFMYTA